MADALAARFIGAERKGMSAGEFGERWGYSERTVWNFIDEGLPTVMAGRLRRVDVDAADRWIREHRQIADDIALSAAEDARKSSGRKAG